MDIPYLDSCASPQNYFQSPISRRCMPVTRKNYHRTDSWTSNSHPCDHLSQRGWIINLGSYVLQLLFKNNWVQMRLKRDKWYKITYRDKVRTCGGITYCRFSIIWCLRLLNPLTQTCRIHHLPIAWESSTAHDLNMFSSQFCNFLSFTKLQIWNEGSIIIFLWEYLNEPLAHVGILLMVN